MNVTKSNLESLVAQLNKRLNRPQEMITNSRYNVGHLSLDYNRYYGGYVLVEVVSAWGSERNPLGVKRHPLNEMYEILQAVINVCVNDSLPKF